MHDRRKSWKYFILAWLWLDFALYGAVINGVRNVTSDTAMGRMLWKHNGRRIKCSWVTAIFIDFIQAILCLRFVKIIWVAANHLYPNDSLVINDWQMSEQELRRGHNRCYNTNLVSRFPTYPLIKQRRSKRMPILLKRKTTKTCFCRPSSELEVATRSTWYLYWTQILLL